MATLGDTIYRGASVWKRLVGNTTTTRKYLSQIGDGDDSSAPTWETVTAEAELPTTTKGDLVVHDGDSDDRLPVGTNGHVLTADSAEDLGVKWAAPTAEAELPTTTKGDLIVHDGDTDERLPVGTNGQVLTADSAEDLGVKWATPSGGGGATVVRKTADEVVNGSDTLQDDDHLLFAIGANEIWAFEFVVQYLSGATPDFRWFVKCPTGATGWQAAVRMHLTTATSATFDAVNSVTNDAALVRSAGGNSARALLVIKGLVVNGSTAGNAQLMWAQNTSNASDTTVYTDSYLVAHRIS